MSAALQTDCPGDNTLAALVEGEASDSDAIIDHLSRCDSCQALVAEIVRRDGDETPRYQIEALVGTGGMGLVFRAFDTVLQRAVALKLLWRAGDSVLEEARMLARFSHPNIVAVHDAGVLEPLGASFIAMELVEGQTLQDWNKTRHDWRDVVAVFSAAGRGLAAAHAREVVHADFKPSNVILADGTARVLVTDFGLARARGQDRSGPTGGTPRYAAPELARTAPDARSDQYAFGVALHEALVGRHPHRDGSCPAPGCERAPARVVRVARRCAAEDPAARYPSMNEALADLAPTRRGSLLVALGLGTAAVVALGVALWPDGCAQEERAGQWEQRLRPPLRDALGDTAFARVAPLLDDWVQSWTERSEVACRSDAAPTERACLDARWATLEAVVDRVAEVEPSAVALAVARLPPVSDCRRPAGDAAAPAVAAEHMTASASALARGQAAWLLGDYAAARQHLEHAIDVASASALLGLQAEATLLLAKVQWHAGEVDAAFQTFASASDVAVRAGLPDLAAVAMGSAAQYVAYYRRDAEVARTWLQQARALASQGDDPMTSLNLDRFEAWVLSTEGDNAAAATLMRSVIDRVDNPLARATCAADLAAFLQWAGDVDAGLAAIDEAIELRSATLGADDPRVTEAKSTRASLLFAADRWDDAIALLRSAEPGLSPRARIVLTEALLEAGRFDEAAAAFEKLEPEGPIAPMVEQLRARVSLHRGEPEAARSILQRLLEQSPAAGKRSPRAVSSLQRDLGRAELALGRYAEARRWLELALTTEVELDRTTVGDIRFELARALAQGGPCGASSRNAAALAIEAWRDKASPGALARASTAERWLGECVNITQ